VTRLVGAELLKLRTTRTFWALSGSALALVLLIVVLNVAIEDAFGAEHDVVELLSTVGLCGLLTLVLGAVIGAGEYRHGTIAWMLLVTPQRLRAVGAQVLACALGGLAIGLGISAITAAIAIPWLAAKDAPMPAAGDLLQVFVGSGVYAGLAAAFGVGLGALLRNQVGAIIGALGWLFLVEPLLGIIPGFDDVITKWFPSGAANATAGTASSDDALGQVPAGLLLAAYAAAFVAAGIIMVRRRDVSA
jgi:ABC-2 type transport system permease protein